MQVVTSVVMMNLIGLHTLQMVVFRHIISVMVGKIVLMLLMKLIVVDVLLK